jgi:nucleoside-diphosphate-sugar epimerase
MKALILGGTGVVGAAVAERLLAADAEVFCLSRRGSSPLGEAVFGDVRSPGLGLDQAARERLQDGLTHIISCYGSVDWRSGPTEAVETHLDGMRNVIAFAAESPEPPRLVHVSSPRC